MVDDLTARIRHRWTRARQRAQETESWFSCSVPLQRGDTWSLDVGRVGSSQLPPGNGRTAPTARTAAGRV